MAKGRKRRTAAAAAVAAADVIEISSASDNDDAVEALEDGKMGRKAIRWYEDVEVWTPRQKRRLDEDCVILPADPSAAAAPDAPHLAAHDDVAVLAERGKVACRDYPHSRCTCVKYPFSKTSHENHCELCFCYVCDVAAPCASWKGPIGHCHASDKDNKWKSMRRLVKKERASLVAPSAGLRNQLFHSYH